MGKEPDYKLDFRQGIISVLLLELVGLFREMKSDQTVSIVAKEPEAINDIFRLLPASSYELEEMDDNDSVYTILIKKVRGRWDPRN